MGASPAQILAMAAATQVLTNRVDDLRDSLIEVKAASTFFTAGAAGGVSAARRRCSPRTWQGRSKRQPPELDRHLHLLLDLGIETAAVWIPASIAVGAWGIMASDAFKNAAQTAQDYNTIIDSGLKASIPGLTNNMVKLRKAVAPQAYQLFGDAMLIAGQKTGAFNTIVLGTGRVLDQLAARATAALTSGSGNGFMRNAIEDVGQLGTAFGNLFGTIGNLVKATPEVARVLLNVGTAILGVTEHITSSGAVQWVLRLGMAFHGAFIYAGLAVTGIIAMGRVIKGLVQEGGLVNKALSWVNGGGIGALAENPMTWAVVGAAAIVGVVIALSSLKDATQQANAATNAGITGATSMAQGQFLLSRGIQSTTAALHAQIAAASKAPYEINPGAGRGATAPSGRVYNAFDIAQNQGELNQLDTWSQRYSGHMAQLSKALGGTAAAQTYLAESGVSFKQMITDTGAAWAQDKLQVEATGEAYKALDYSTGMLGNTLQVLHNQQTNQYAAIQNINSAMSTWIGNITGPQTGFDSFIQGQATLAQNWDKANTAGLSLTHHLGDLAGAFKTTHAAIDGLKPADLALNSAFASSVTNANSLIASFRTAGLTGRSMTDAIKASIDPLVRYARGSQEATSQLVALAQEAGYNGPDNLKNLVAWLGNAHDATQKLKDAADQATIQEALLTGSFRAQGNAIASYLLGQMDLEEVKTSSLTADVKAYGDAVARSGAQSDAAQAARTRVIDDIVRLGQHTNSTTDQIAAMITRLLDIPRQVAINMVLSAEASIRVSELISASYTTGSGQHRSGNYASGVPGATTPSVRLGTNFTSPSVASSYTGTGGGDHYHISVAGDTNPDAAAQRIIQLVRTHKNKYGIKQTGIG